MDTENGNIIITNIDSTAPITCRICSNKQMGRSTHSDKRLVSPCLCQRPVHYNCVAKTVRHKKRCGICKEPYAYYEYGTIFDYIWRYPCRTTLPILFYIVVLSCMAYKIFEANIPNGGLIEYILLLRREIVAFLVISLILIPWLTYTFVIARRDFVKRRGQIIVFDRFTIPKILNNNDAQRMSTNTINTSVYIQCCNQTSINTPTDFEKEKCLAASTPLPTTGNDTDDAKHFLMP